MEATLLGWEALRLQRSLPGWEAPRLQQSHQQGCLGAALVSSWPALLTISTLRAGVGLLFQNEAESEMWGVEVGGTTR